MAESGTKNTKKIIAIIAAIAVVAAAVVAAIMILKPKPLDDNFFVSDDTKLVYNVGKEIDGGIYDARDIYMVYNYSGEKITKLVTYYGYEDEATAKLAADKYAEIFTPNDDILEVNINGRFICLTAKTHVYEGTTASSVRAIIDFQEQGDAADADFIEETVIEDADVTINWD